MSSIITKPILIFLNDWFSIILAASQFDGIIFCRPNYICDLFVTCPVIQTKEVIGPSKCLTSDYNQPLTRYFQAKQFLTGGAALYIFVKLHISFTILLILIVLL